MSSSMPRRPPAPAPTPATDNWRIYRGSDEPHDGIDRLPSPPPWRTFDGGPVLAPRTEESLGRHGPLGAAHRARNYQVSAETVDIVNAALYLRRPLLVTGKPGTGKSTLAESIAWELGLGSVLRWPINSHSTLNEGLYRYDAVGRLHEASLRADLDRDSAEPPDIGRYIQLGPLGTALLPQERPRVLLIDELDKSGVDLPHDLLHVLEDGGFDVLELARLPDTTPVVETMVVGSEDRVPIRRGHVQCRAFPIVVITSNAEREFPPAFLRRVLRLDITPPDETVLANIVAAQLGDEVLADSQPLIDQFLRRRETGDLATDQLLNAVFLATSGVRPPAETRDRLASALMRSLDGRGG
jgi:MoxR-like ATPase